MNGLRGVRFTDDQHLVNLRAIFLGLTLMPAFVN
jgi:hypothetical protein